MLGLDVLQHTFDALCCLQHTLQINIVLCKLIKLTANSVISCLAQSMCFTAPSLSYACSHIVGTL